MAYRIALVIGRYLRMFLTGMFSKAIAKELFYLKWMCSRHGLNYIDDVQASEKGPLIIRRLR
jgi:hypothetical protein